MSEPIDYQNHWDKIITMTEKELDIELEKLVDLPSKMLAYQTTICRAVLKVLKENNNGNSN